MESTQKLASKRPVAPFEVEVFYDGACPLCRKEIGMIRRWDRRAKIRFTDIADDGFQAADYGKKHAELMAEIHGRDASGQWITGVEVFRQLYGAVGFGPVVAATRLPVIRQMLDWLYSWFAERRLRLTGRCESDTCNLVS